MRKGEIKRIIAGLAYFGSPGVTLVEVIVPADMATVGLARNQ
jgi:hypothetical protein